MTDTAPAGPLAGLRVLDISTVVAAPFAATLLADYGADVIKAELPGEGDGLRTFPPFKEGKSLWWKVANRGKRFIEEYTDGARLVDPDGRHPLALVLRTDRLSGVRPDREGQHGMALRALLAPLTLAEVPTAGDEHRDVDTWEDLRDLS